MFFRKEKIVPCNREFVMQELEQWICSDEHLMNIFYYKYAKKWTPSFYAKRMETLRKDLWLYKKEWKIIEIVRKNRASSCEIFYATKL